MIHNRGFPGTSVCSPGEPSPPAYSPASCRMCTMTHVRPRADSIFLTLQLCMSGESHPLVPPHYLLLIVVSVLIVNPLELLASRCPVSVSCRLRSPQSTLSEPYWYVVAQVSLKLETVLLPRPPEC